jgi:hypothetical protein
MPVFELGKMHPFFDDGDESGGCVCDERVRTRVSAAAGAL